MARNSLGETPKQEKALNGAFLSGYRQAVDEIRSIISEYIEDDGSGPMDLLLVDIEAQLDEWVKTSAAK